MTVPHCGLSSPCIALLWVYQDGFFANRLIQPPRACFASIFLFTSSSTSSSSRGPQPYHTTVANPISAEMTHPAIAPIALGVQPYQCVIEDFLDARYGN